MHRLAILALSALAVAGCSGSSTPPASTTTGTAATAPGQTGNYDLVVSGIPPAPSTAPAPDARLITVYNIYNYPVTVDITSGQLRGQMFVMPAATVGQYRGYVWVPAQKFSANLQSPTGTLLSRQVY